MRTIVAAAMIVGLAMGSATAEQNPGVGPDPKLPEPQHSLLPTVNIAPASGSSIRAGSIRSQMVTSSLRRPTRRRSRESLA